MAQDETDGRNEAKAGTRRGQAIEVRLNGRVLLTGKVPESGDNPENQPMALVDIELYESSGYVANTRVQTWVPLNVIREA